MISQKAKARKEAEKARQCMGAYDILDSKLRSAQPIEPVLRSNPSSAS